MYKQELPLMYPDDPDVMKVQKPSTILLSTFGLGIKAMH